MASEVGLVFFSLFFIIIVHVEVMIMFVVLKNIRLVQLTKFPS